MMSDECDGAVFPSACAGHVVGTVQVREFLFSGSPGEQHSNLWIEVRTRRNPPCVCGCQNLLRALRARCVCLTEVSEAQSEAFCVLQSKGCW